MQVRYTSNAFASLVRLINFIETNNTEGAGVRWLNQYENFLEKTFLNARHKRVCNNAAFKKLDLKCIYFKDWLIAFSIQEDIILIRSAVAQIKNYRLIRLIFIIFHCNLQILFSLTPLSTYLKNSPDL